MKIEGGHSRMLLDSLRNEPNKSFVFHLVGFGIVGIGVAACAGARKTEVILNRRHQVRSAPIVQIHRPRRKSPQRRGAPLIAVRLRSAGGQGRRQLHAIRQARPHVMDEQVRVKIYCLIAQRGDDLGGMSCEISGNFSRGVRLIARIVAQRATDGIEQGLSVTVARSRHVRRKKHHKSVWFLFLWVGRNHWAPVL